jgi:hypothetical protein
LFADFITARGVRSLATLFGVPIHTVYSWRRRNLIPRTRWDVLIDAYGLSWAELRDMETGAASAIAA